jgi:hypothetical protein
MNPAFGGSLALLSTNPVLAAAIREDLQALAATATGLSPQPLIDGASLIAAGLTPGPGFRSVIDAVYDLQLEGLIRDFEHAIAKARELAPHFGIQQSEQP